MALTSIGWTDISLNPGVYGCSEVGPDCSRCYAAVQAARLAHMGMSRYMGLTHETVSGMHWNGTVRVNYREIAVAFSKLPKRKPARVFVTSMADLFHDDVPDDFLDQCFAHMAVRPHLTFQILTKRTARMRRYFERPDLGMIIRNLHALAPDALRRGANSNRVTLPLPNVWLGTSAGRQDLLEQRIGDLLATHAVEWFLSLEPLLGPLDIRPYLGTACESCGATAPDVDWCALDSSYADGHVIAVDNPMIRMSRTNCGPAWKNSANLDAKKNELTNVTSPTTR